MIIIYVGCIFLASVPLLFVWFFLTTVLFRKRTAILDEIKEVSFEGTLLASRNYPELEKGINKDFEEAYGRFQLLFPAILLTLLYIIAFLHVLAFVVHKFTFPGIQFFPEPYLSTLLPPIFAFLGAYLFNFGYMVRRIYLEDVSYTVFWSAIHRTLLATGLGIVFGAVIDIQEGTHSENWYYVFFGMGFLTNDYLRWVLIAGQKKLGETPSQKITLRLTSISGINFWQESRLEEEGIESVQNLARSDVLNLAVKTQFNLATLIDWVDQAILLDRLDNKANILKDKGLISGAIDLAWASPKNSDGNTSAAHAVAEVLDVKPLFAELLMDNLFEDIDVQYIWALWQTKFDTAQARANLVSEPNVET